MLTNVNREKFRAYLMEQEEDWGSLEHFARQFAERLGEPPKGKAQLLHNWREGKFKAGLTPQSIEKLCRWFGLPATKTGRSYVEAWLQDDDPTRPNERKSGIRRSTKKPIKAISNPDTVQVIPNKVIEKPVDATVRDFIKNASIIELIDLSDLIHAQIRRFIVNINPALEAIKVLQAVGGSIQGDTTNMKNPGATQKLRRYKPCTIIGYNIQEFLGIVEIPEKEFAERAGLSMSRYRELIDGADSISKKELADLAKVFSTEQSMECSVEDLLDLCERSNCQIVD